MTRAEDMNEEQWLACRTPGDLVAALHGLGLISDRKGRLLAVACCRRVWQPFLGAQRRAVIALGLQRLGVPLQQVGLDERSRNAVEVAERVAEGLATEEERQVAESAAQLAWFEIQALYDVVEDTDGAIYDERAFDRLPILADALEEAGCTNPEMLDHCRQPGAHARGCWVVDALPGRK
jgi:hypothetical protein